MEEDLDPNAAGPSHHQGQDVDDEVEEDGDEGGGVELIHVPWEDREPRVWHENIEVAEIHLDAD